MMRSIISPTTAMEINFDSKSVKIYANNFEAFCIFLISITQLFFASKENYYAR